MEKLELRFTPSNLTMNDDGLSVEGLVNQTGAWSHTLGVRKKFKEKIMPGAFDKAIQSAPRIDFLAEHDTRQLLATTENDSLQLWEDEEGLKMKANICPTTYGKDAYQLMKSNLVNHMSFGFRATADKWKELNDGTYERTVSALDLAEVSVVRNPAYPQSSISARGIEFIEDVEIPADAEIEKEEVKQERSLPMKANEQRAYASYLYSKNDVINAAMELVADCSSISGYLMQYVGQDTDTAAVLVSLQNTITMANKIINDEIQILVDNYNEADAAIKAANNDTVEEGIEEELQEDTEGIDPDSTMETNSLKTEEVEIEKRNEEPIKSEEETKTEEVKTEEVKVEDSEERSFDINKYRSRVKEKR